MHLCILSASCYRVTNYSSYISTVTKAHYHTGRAPDSRHNARFQYRFSFPSSSIGYRTIDRQQRLDIPRRQPVSWPMPRHADIADGDDNGRRRLFSISRGGAMAFRYAGHRDAEDEMSSSVSPSHHFRRAGMQGYGLIDAFMLMLMKEERRRRARVRDILKTIAMPRQRARASRHQHTDPRYHRAPPARPKLLIFCA